MMSRRKSYFAVVYKIYEYFFEYCLNIQFVTIGRLMSDNLKENFFCDKQTEGF